MLLSPPTVSIEQLRARSREYPARSPEREAFIVAIVRHENALDDAHTDAVIMRSWRLTDSYCG